METVLKHRCTMTEAGPKELPGCGKYILEIADHGGRTTVALYFLDSGNESQVADIEGG